MSRSGARGRVVGFLRSRTRAGASRVRSSLFPLLQTTFCAVAAFWAAETLLGHEQPLFAATAAIVSLGFGREPRVRRTLEVAVGVTIGIAVGDLLVALLGGGLWQAAVVLFTSLVLARFLDGGAIFTTQMGLQALLVVLLPLPPGGPFTRSADAVVGGLLAIAVTALAARDPRTEPSNDLRLLLGELAGVLRECSKALRDGDSTLAWHALVRARATQKTMDALPVALRSARELATLSPAHRRRRDEIARLSRVAEKTDLAVRNARVFARRLASVITNAALTERGVASVTEFLDELAEAVDTLSRTAADPQQAVRLGAERRARDELSACASALTPAQLGVEGLQGEGLVLLLRPLVVDLMEASGIDRPDAVAYLPRL